MTEHTPGFYAIEKYRIERRRNILRIAIQNAKKYQKRNRGLLAVMEKYESSKDDRLSVKVDIIVTDRRVQNLSDEYTNLGFELMDIAAAQIDAIGPRDEITTAEDSAPVYIQREQMSRLVRWFHDLKSRIR